MRQLIHKQLPSAADVVRFVNLNPGIQVVGITENSLSRRWSVFYYDANPDILGGGITSSKAVAHMYN